MYFKRFSLKYKILGLLVLVPCLGIGLYFYTVKSLFGEDKKAYIFDTVFHHSVSLKSGLTQKIESYNKSMNYIATGWDNNFNEFDKRTLEIIQLDKSLRGLNIYSSVKMGDKALFQLSKNEKLSFKLMNPFKTSAIRSSLQVDFRDLENGNVYFYKKIANKSIIIELQVNLEQFLGEINHKSTFKNFLFTQEGRQVSVKKGDNNALSIFNYVKTKRIQPGVFEFNNEIISNQKIGDFLIFSSISNQKAFSAMDILNKKSALFLIAVLSLSLFISVIASKVITRNIFKLHSAALELSKGNFDVEVKIKSNDEIGQFAQTFSNMTTKIKDLLGTLEEYNRTLELKVETRTAELNDAMAMQKTMLDSVGQGFVIINNKNDVENIYSKVSVDMFDGTPDEMSLGELFHLNEDESKEVKEYFQVIFDNVMPFKDLIGAAPRSFKNKDKRSIHLDYFEVEDEARPGIVVVATDKTQELAAIDRAKVEKGYVDLVLKISKNPNSYNRFVKYLEESSLNLQSFMDKEREAFDRESLFRIIHTIKGNASYYSFSELVNICHEFESYLQGESEIDLDQCGTTVDSILLSIKSSIISVDEMIGDLLKLNENSSSDISLNNLKILSQHLEEKPDKAKDYLKLIMNSKPAGVLMQTMEALIGNTANELGKSIRVNKVGEEERLPTYIFEKMEISLAHIVNNCVDHGIKTDGEITLVCETFDSYSVLMIKDDGDGVDIAKLVEKAQSKFINTDNWTEQQMIDLIFENEISIKEEVSLHSGRGVGMSEVKSSIEQVGGTIRVRSKRGEGTKFIMILPSGQNGILPIAC